MSTRLLRITRPAPLLPTECALQSEDELSSHLRAHVVAFTAAPEAQALARALWSQGEVRDSLTRTHYLCREATGELTACPHCDQAVPEVVHGGVNSAWCSCLQGEWL